MKRKFLGHLGRMLLLLLAAAGAQAGVTDLASSPLVTSSSSSVRPNLMFILDDSGSMGWDYLPDWADTSDTSLDHNNTWNGVAYNPSVTYSPPIFYKNDGAGTIDTTTYKSMTSANSSAWGSVPNDGYGVQSTSNSNLVGNAYYTTFISGEYCDKPNLRNCVTQSAPSSTYPYPATLRWCTTTALTTCQAIRIDSGSPQYIYARYPIQATTTISVSGSTSTSVTSIKVNSVEILNGATTASSTSSTVASRIASGITLAGYSASSSGSTVTITAPVGSGAITYTPVITKASGSGTMTLSTSAFSGGVPGSNLHVDIVSGNNSYPYPGTAAKAPTRTDCAGTTCTYVEEMTNYANWWAYYHTRMQMMKTSTSLAFQTVGSTYRVGYATINNNQGNALVNLDTFDADQKYAWYARLFAAKPNNSTPLRATLSEIGRIFAGKYNGSSYNSVTVTDPMQYSCQQNFTILSTDGYWNESSGYKQLNGSTDVGNQDAAEPRPYNDGGGSTVTAKTDTVSQSIDTTPRTVLNRQTRTDSTATTSTRTRTNTYTRTRLTTSTSDSCSNPNNTRRRTYSGTSTETETTVTTSNQSMVVLTTTVFSDAATTTTTVTRSVVTTNGVVTSDTSLTTTSGPTTVPTTISGPTAVATASGAPSVTTAGPTSTFSPAATVADINWGSALTDSCNNAATSDTLVLASSGTWSTPGVSSNVTNGSLSGSTGGYPQTTYGTTTTTSTGPTTGATTTTTVTTGGTSNTLSDVAEYFYINDLRTSALGNCTGSSGLDVCTNDVPQSGLDGASWQHMTTFTLGLGASGFMQFSPSYPSATSGDYFDVKNGTTANPSGGVCSWQSGGACNWPTPVSNEQTTIDDLWHAAVNGRGTYFSATSPASLNAGLSAALAGVSTRTGSSAAATTSNPNVTSGDNFVFSSTFTTQEWDGQLVRQQLDLSTGVVSSTIDWSAQAQLDSTAYTARTIYMFDSTQTNKLKPFDWANLTATTPGERDNFLNPHIGSLSQFCVTGYCLSAADQDASHAAGQNLVNYLRGERSNEGLESETTKYYRVRQHILGDIVNAEAVYVKQPLYGYADAGYTDFINNNKTRQGMVYVASNDGMLHAFNSSTGAEAWAYVPTMVLPNLYKLADKTYAAHHQYFADGTPVAGDAYFDDGSGPAWHTIIVAGLNGGGRGYYALDVTVPTAPKALWEFTNDKVGYTYGNPTITKLMNNTWVVLVTSGYNNVPEGSAYPTADGVGRLWVLNAATGVPVSTIPSGISTGAGVIATPSGLGRISAWVTNATSDNTALRAYGGDMLGNLWRFDINGNIGAAGYDAQKLVTLYSNAAGTVTQPITTRPELGLVGDKAVVFVGTGRFLGGSDVSDTTQQTFYGIKDNLDTATFTNPMATGSGFVQQVVTTGACPTGSPVTICTTGQTVRTSTSNAVNFATDKGWYVNLPDGVGGTSADNGSERANTDPTLALGTLGFTTNVPNKSVCTAGGYSYRYILDYRTGAPVSTSTTGVSAVKLGNALSTRGVFVRLPNNTVVQLTRLSDGTTMTTNVPIGSGVAQTRRISWRELIQDQ